MAQNEATGTAGRSGLSAQVGASGSTGPEQDAGTGEGAKKSHLPEIPVAELARVESQEDLVRVLQLHEQWTRAVLDPNVEVASGRANLKGVDLRGYDLAGVNLSGANLSGANLAGCDLEGANLTVANLERAVLATCNLRHAKLRRARLDHADLRGADLTGAVLTGVDLSKAILKSPDEPLAADVAKEPVQPAGQAAARAEDEPFQLLTQTVAGLGNVPILTTPDLPSGVVL